MSYEPDVLYMYMYVMCSCMYMYMYMYNYNHGVCLGWAFSQVSNIFSKLSFTMLCFKARICIIHGLPCATHRSTLPSMNCANSYFAPNIDMCIHVCTLYIHVHVYTCTSHFKGVPVHDISTCFSFRCSEVVPVQCGASCREGEGGREGEEEAIQALQRYQASQGGGGRDDAC